MKVTRRWIVALVIVLAGCAGPTEPGTRWIVECYDVWGRETTVAFEDYGAARDWKRARETRVSDDVNPWICYLYEEES